MKKLLMLMMMPLLFTGFTIKAEAAPPGHIFIFTTGNPNENPEAINSSGHISLHFDSEDPSTGTATGNILARAVNNEWATSINLNDGWFFDEANNEFTGTFSVRDVVGESGLEPEQPLSNAPVGVVIPTSNPNVVFMIVTGSPPFS